MKEFNKQLELKIVDSLSNNYGIENFDEYRFGIYKTPTLGFVDTLKFIVKKIIRYSTPTRPIFDNAHSLVFPYDDSISAIWDHIGQFEKELLVSLIAYRVLGYTKVKLPRNDKAYWEAIETAKTLANPNDTYDPHFMHFILQKFDLSPIGYDANFYFSEIAIAIDFIIEQYSLKRQGKTIVSANKGDVVLDVGGCWGDSALYFANKVGETGKVYSFEFIPDNIKLFNLNLSFNQGVKSRVYLVEKPVHNKSRVPVYFLDFGPGSKVKFEPFPEQTGSTTTISIDDFVKENNIEKVDFIKMDIEGAELYALEGAKETIRKFRPKLAIASYHSLNDLFNIPKWILDLDLGYEIFIDHYTIHTEETVCFAILKNK